MTLRVDVMPAEADDMLIKRNKGSGLGAVREIYFIEKYSYKDTIYVMW